MLSIRLELSFNWGKTVVDSVKIFVGKSWDSFVIWRFVVQVIRITLNHRRTNDNSSSAYEGMQNTSECSGADPENFSKGGGVQP